MKIADISPVFKKLDNISKDNYQPISGLSNFIKRFEKILFSQLNDYMEANSQNVSLDLGKIKIDRTLYYRSSNLGNPG